MSVLSLFGGAAKSKAWKTKEVFYCGGVVVWQCGGVAVWWLAGERRGLKLVSAV